MSENARETLRDRIYGPYPDHMLLQRNAFHQSKVVALKDFRMYSGGQQIGFDDTEYIGSSSGRPNELHNEGIVCLGVLEIENMDWLTEKGYTILEEDVKEYDSRAHLEHLKVSRSASFSLRNLFYGSQKSLQVIISFKKQLMARFLQGNDPTKLLLQSSHGPSNRRDYHIASYHVATYQRSRKFDMRCRLRAAIVYMVKTDPRKTPLEKRDIDWITTRYFEAIRPLDETDEIRHVLYLHVPDNEPVNPRHLSRTEVRSYFAAHCEWLLANQLASQGQSEHAVLINVRKWILFCLETRREAKEAKRRGVTWGIPPGEDIRPGNLASRLAEYGQDEAFWERRLNAVINAAKKKKTAFNKQPQRVEPEPREMVDIPNQNQHTYDSDFSEASTSSWTGSDSEHESGPEMIVNAPHALLQPPRLGAGRFDWLCSMCDYHINMLDLTESQLSSLPPTLVTYLKSKMWNIRDAHIQKAFFEIVSIHRKKHLEEQGIEIRGKPGSRYLVQVKKGSPKAKEDPKGVKVEESDNLPLDVRRSSRVSYPSVRSGRQIP